MAEQCPKCLPIETIIQSTVELEDIGELAGGKCLLILTSDTSVVNPDCPTMTYSAVDEALTDFGAVTAINDSILAAFSQTPRVDQVVVGYYDPTDLTTLDVISNCGKCKAFVTPELRDDPVQLDLAAWAEANKCVYGFDVCDPLHETADPSTIGAQITAAGYEYSYGFYHQDCTVQKASAVLSQNCGHDFGQAGQDYTALYENYVGIPPLNIDTQTLENLTGFSSVSGLDATAVNHLNVCACIEGCGGELMFWGLTASGDFFDNRHYTDDVDARIVAAQCNALRGGVSATIQGYAQLTNAVRNILRTDQLNGYIAGAIDNEDEQGIGYQVTIPSPAQAGQALRSNRIAPCVEWSARRNNPVHIACNTGLITQ